MKHNARNTYASPRAIFAKWLETANNGEIFAKMDEIRSHFGSDDSANKACRTFLDLCKDELSVRDDFRVIVARRAMRGAA